MELIPHYPRALVPYLYICSMARTDRTAAEDKDIEDSSCMISKICGRFAGEINKKGRASTADAHGDAATYLFRHTASSHDQVRDRQISSI
jgi:hypothetical protein